MISRVTSGGIGRYLCLHRGPSKASIWQANTHKETGINEICEAIPGVGNTYNKAFRESIERCENKLVTDVGPQTSH
jgi:hypothetical protein